MSADDLTSFSYVILLLVGSGGAAPHDLLRMHRQGNWIYWTAAESRFYSEPKRLAQLRYLNARREPGQTTDRTVYTLTPRGRKAIAGWLAEPSGFIRIQNEPAARLNGADLAADEQTVVHSLRAIRPHIDEQLLWLERAEREARGLPHRERYLQINHRLSRRILVAFSDWLDEVEAEFGSSDGQTRVQHRKVRRRGT
jgi:PadR family transcriptional regulator AphA